MVGDPSYSKDNFLTAILRVIREKGLLSTFSGLFAMLSKQVPYTMAKQVSFDFFAKSLYKIAEQQNFKSDHLKLIISIAAAFPASILSCISSQPGDMILTATYQSKEYQNFLSIISSIYQKYGVSGFFLGLRARLIHVALIITTQLVIYDMVKQFFGLAATGSH